MRAENWGLCPFGGGDLGHHRTQCGNGRGLPARQILSGSVQPLATIRQRYMQDRQRSDSIGRTVLQTVAQKNYPTVPS